MDAVGHTAHAAMANLRVPPVDKMALRASGEIAKPFAKLLAGLAKAALRIG